MNKKGQVILVRLMIYVTAVIFAIMTIPFLKENLEDVTSVSNLNCGAAGLTTGIAMTCLLVDLILPIFIGVVIGVAGVLILKKE